MPGLIRSLAGVFLLGLLQLLPGAVDKQDGEIAGRLPVSASEEPAGADNSLSAPSLECDESGFV